MEKRVTNKNFDEFNPEYDFCIECKYFGEPNGCNRLNGTCLNYERFMETYNRLAELEDKIEQGTLIELPFIIKCSTKYAVVVARSGRGKRLYKTVTMPIDEAERILKAMKEKNNEKV